MSKFFTIFLLFSGVLT
uniref:Uncharacterized protein n=1 Tax=Rhizophora mucronata TaxID=61149 RepID=A0A2P2MM74_RHIMU